MLPQTIDRFALTPAICLKLVGHIKRLAGAWPGATRNEAVFMPTMNAEAVSAGPAVIHAPGARPTRAGGAYNLPTTRTPQYSVACAVTGEAVSASITHPEPLRVQEKLIRCFV